MNYKKEPCRNFQRGSCKYGDRCKFLHVIQQQPKLNASGFATQAGLNQQQKPNPFGFGVQSTDSRSHQQQKANPFGFGLQNGQGGSQLQQKSNPFGFGVQNSQSRVSSDRGSKHNQFKPFQNKWTREGTPSSQQPGDKPQVKDHKCTDPESCKQVIVDDLQNERPLWKLTCYGHSKNGPCEIAGDISFEELRAAAYDDAKRGLSLQSIVDREKSFLNSKLIEFENLLHTPAIGPLSSATAKQTSFPGFTQSSFSTNTIQSNASISGFGQQGPPFNTGFSPRLSAPSVNPFGFGQPNSISSSAKPSEPFVTQQSNQSFTATFTPNINSFGNTGVNDATHEQFSSFTASTQNSANGLNLSPNTDELTVLNAQSENNLQRGTISGDMSIWLKDKWTPGEIPEEAPPDAYVNS